MPQLPPLSQPASLSQALVAAADGVAVAAIIGRAATSGAVAMPRLRAWWLGLRCRPRAGADDRMRCCAIGRIPLAACEVSCRVRARELPGRVSTASPRGLRDLTVTGPEGGSP